MLEARRKTHALTPAARLLCDPFLGGPGLDPKQHKVQSSHPEVLNLLEALRVHMQSSHLASLGGAKALILAYVSSVFMLGSMS